MAYVNLIIDVRVLDCVRLVILQSIESHPDIGVVVVRPVGEDQPFLSGVDAEVRHRNAILVVEFAKQAEEEQGLSPVDAAVQAARTRLRPILMTSFAFILGVVPLVIATGPGAELRLGWRVFNGVYAEATGGLGMNTIESEIRVLASPGPRAPEMAMASSTDGNA